MNEQLLGQTAPPPPRGRGRGCGAERRQWRMQRGGAPVAVEKIEQASSAKIFSGTARRWGQMRLRLPWERICAQYGFRFFIQEKSKFVSSTASDRKGFVKGESVPLDRILVPFVRTKGTPPRRAVLTMPLQKAPRRRRQDEIWYKGGRGARVRDYIFPRGNPAGRRKKLAPQGFDNLRNVH